MPLTPATDILDDLIAQIDATLEGRDYSLLINRPRYEPVDRYELRAIADFTEPVEERV